MKQKANKIIRVSEDFNKELEDVQKKRKENGFDEEKEPSKPTLTQLIRHHELWPKIKADLLHFDFRGNRGGQITLLLFFGIFIVFAGVMFLLVVGITSSKINDALDQDIAVGQVNLQTINSQTYGVFHSTLINNADWWGAGLIFGVILGIFLSAFLTRRLAKKVGIVIDIFVIFAFFLFSLYLRKVYSLIVDAFTGAGEPFLEATLPNTSSFLLNLPVYVVIVGVIAMVLFHSSITTKQEELVGGGSFQGI